MIVGGIYLGKKVKKSLRARQAQRAAAQLTNPYDIVERDFSDELRAKEPPSSPTTSRSSSPSRRGVPPSTLSRFKSSPSTSSRDQEWEQFAQRSSLEEHSEDPPSYEVAMSAGTEASTRTSRHDTLPRQMTQLQMGEAPRHTVRYSPSVVSRHSDHISLAQSSDHSRPTTPQLYRQTIPEDASGFGSPAAHITSAPAELPGSVGIPFIAELPGSPTEFVELPAKSLEASMPELPAENGYTRLADASLNESSSPTELSENVILSLEPAELAGSEAEQPERDEVQRIGPREVANTAKNPNERSLDERQHPDTMSAGREENPDEIKISSERNDSAKRDDTDDAEYSDSRHHSNHSRASAEKPWPEEKRWPAEKQRQMPNS